MSEGLFAVIIISIPLLLFFIRQIRIAKKINKEEREFIKKNRDKYAILIFQGDNLRMTDKFDCEQSFSKIKNLYGTYTFAIPEGEYVSIATFEFPYGNGTKLGSRSSTPAIHKILSLKQGCAYRYRLRDQPVDKRDKYKIIFEEEVISRPSDVKIDFSHIVVFEENDRL